MAEATDYANSIAQEENDKALQAMKDSGKTEFHDLTDDERAQWMEALKPVYEQAATRTGPEIIEAMQKAVAGN
jgi:C4-dicarboxylate-binding protein DctP